MSPDRLLDSRIFLIAAMMVTRSARARSRWTATRSLAVTSRRLASSRARAASSMDALTSLERRFRSSIGPPLEVHEQFLRQLRHLNGRFSALNCGGQRRIFRGTDIPFLLASSPPVGGFFLDPVGVPPC